LLEGPTLLPTVCQRLFLLTAPLHNDFPVSRRMLFRLVKTESPPPFFSPLPPCFLACPIWFPSCPPFFFCGAFFDVSSAPPFWDLHILLWYNDFSGIWPVSGSVLSFLFFTAYFSCFFFLRPLFSFFCQSPRPFSFPPFFQGLFRLAPPYPSLCGIPWFWFFLTLPFPFFDPFPGFSENRTRFSALFLNPFDFVLFSLGVNF